MITLENIVLNEKKYIVIKNEKEAIDVEPLTEKLTDFYDEYDYIVGDWAYGKVRLKGFFKKDNKKVKAYSDISNLEKYLKNNCAHGCKWFQIERIWD